MTTGLAHRRGMSRDTSLEQMERIARETVEGFPLAFRESARAVVLRVVDWPDEDMLVVRTPPPPPNTLDSTGYYLSPVASVGADAPPLPENSGSGRRVVCDQR